MLLCPGATLSTCLILSVLTRNCELVSCQDKNFNSISFRLCPYKSYFNPVVQSGVFCFN